jgi:hypothetical protein
MQAMQPYPCVAVYKPYPGKEAELDRLISEHHGILSSQDLLTDRKPTYLKSPGGFRIEIIEWKTEASAEKAHENAIIGEMWERFAKAAEFKALKDIDGAERPFAGFQPLDLGAGRAQERNFSDTMMSSENYDAKIAFYERFVGLKLKLRTDSFAMLEDQSTGQKLCLTNGRSVEKTGPSILVKNLDGAMRDLKALGGSVTATWEFENMKGANAVDFEGHEILIYENKA